MKNRKRLLKTVGLLTAATVMTVSLNAESVLAYSTGEEAAIVASEEDPYDVTKINLKDMFNQNQEDYKELDPCDQEMIWSIIQIVKKTSEKKKSANMQKRVE